MPDIRIPRDGAVFWFESPDYWEEWYGKTTYERQNDVSIYSDMPHVEPSKYLDVVDSVIRKDHDFLTELGGGLSEDARLFRKKFLEDAKKK